MAEVLVHAEQIGKTYGTVVKTVALHEVLVRDPGWGVRLGHRSVGFRQVHAAQPRRPARHADHWSRDPGRPRHDGGEPQATRRPAQRRHRLRLPVSLPAAGVQRPRERADAGADRRRRPGRARAASRTEPRPAGSRGPREEERQRSLRRAEAACGHRPRADEPSPRWFSRTSPPGTSTRRTRRPCTSSSERSTRSSGPPSSS